MTTAANSFTERQLDGITILTLQGALKGAVEQTLKDRVDKLVRDGCMQVVIDLKNLPYIDSTDLGRLIRCHISIRQAGGRVRLCNLSDRVKDIMRISRLDSVLEIYDSEESAIDDIRSEE